MGKFVKFDKINNKDTYGYYELVDIVDIKALKYYGDDDIVLAIDNVFDDVNLGYYPTYCAFVENGTIKIYYDKDCPEDKKEDKYDRVDFLDGIFKELEED